MGVERCLDNQGVLAGGEGRPLGPDGSPLSPLPVALAGLLTVCVSVPAIFRRPRAG